MRNRNAIMYTRKGRLFNKGHTAGLVWLLSGPPALQPLLPPLLSPRLHMLPGHVPAGRLLCLNTAIRSTTVLLFLFFG